MDIFKTDTGDKNGDFIENGVANSRNTNSKAVLKPIIRGKNGTDKLQNRPENVPIFRSVNSGSKLRISNSKIDSICSDNKLCAVKQNIVPIGDRPNNIKPNITPIFRSRNSVDKPCNAQKIENDGERLKICRHQNAPTLDVKKMSYGNNSNKRNMTSPKCLVPPSSKVNKTQGKIKIQDRLKTNNTAMPIRKPTSAVNKTKKSEINNEESFKFAIPTMNQLGGIKRVPTSKPEKKIGRLCPVQDKTNVDVKIEKVYNQPVYFNNGDNSNIKNHINKIRENISIDVKFHVDFIELTKDKGLVSDDVFDKVLDMYENNQCYFIKCLEAGMLQNVIDKLNENEIWFCSIIEPKPKSDENIDDWEKREKSKLIDGVSAYCDDTLKKFINKMPLSTISYIKKCHKELF